MSGFEKFIDGINELNLPEIAKVQILKNAEKLKNEKVHVLITGATGCGKSSTINALFETEQAKVGQGSNPETMDITRYDLGNVVLFDSPGLGDGKEADLRHSKNITEKLLEQDGKGNLLIDLVLVILDGSSRDLGTSYDLINKVIIPNLKDTSRLLIAINQADMAMKGRHWDNEKNQPEPTLIEFLDEKVATTKARIKEATGVDVEPIYYSAGYKDGDEAQNPWNLAKLLAHILKHTNEKKRIVYAPQINKDEKIWESNDDLHNYQAETESNFFSSFVSYVTEGIANAAEAVGEFVNKMAKEYSQEIKKTGKMVAVGVAQAAKWLAKLF